MNTELTQPSLTTTDDVDPTRVDVQLEAAPLAAAPTVSTAKGEGAANQDLELLSSLDAQSRRTAIRALRAGALNASDLDLLLDEDAMKEFEQLWREASSPVLEAERAQMKVGKALVDSRFESGDFEEVLFPESERKPDGGFDLTEVNKRTHPDDWLSIRVVARPGGGQIVRRVTIPPGSATDLDDARTNFRLAEQLRTDAVSQFVARQRLKKEIKR